MGALLVSLTVVSAVAKGAKVQRPLEIIGAITVAVAVAAGLLVLLRLTKTPLAEPRTEEHAVTYRRTRVASALHYGDLKGAIDAQSDVVEMIRRQNIQFVVAMRTATRWIPYVFVLLSFGLCLYIAGK